VAHDAPPAEPTGLAEGAVVLNELVAYSGFPGDWIGCSCVPALPARVVEDGAFQVKLFSENCSPDLPSVTLDAFVVVGG
jgi:hypothetical protein